MSNKHQIHHNPQHNLHQGNGSKAAVNVPMQQQPKESETSMESFSKSALRMIKENPIPAALIGAAVVAGVTWLVVSNQSSKRSASSRFIEVQLGKSGEQLLEAAHGFVKNAVERVEAIATQLSTSAAKAVSSMS